MSVLKLRGFEIHKGFLNVAAQRELHEAVREVAKLAPVFSPMTPYGKPMTVRMTSAGKYGWYSDSAGYQYRKNPPQRDGMAPYSNENTKGLAGCFGCSMKARVLLDQLLWSRCADGHAPRQR